MIYFRKKFNDVLFRITFITHRFTDFPLPDYCMVTM